MWDTTVPLHPPDTVVSCRIETIPAEISGAVQVHVREGAGADRAMTLPVLSLGATFAAECRTAVTLCCVLLSVPVVVAAQTAELEQGKRLYESQCGSCHGPLGNGGKGANLARPRLRRATNDQALTSIIRRGISGTEMPGSALNPRQVSSIAGYVKTLGRVEQVEIPGDAGRGEEVYADFTCGQCHALDGQGGILGPALDDIGARRSAAHLRESLIEPEASVPTGFLRVRVVTEDGRRLTGIRVNEDGFSIQFRDLAGRLFSFWKDELSDLRKEWKRSPMVSYESTLTPEQMDDLVAYLVSLQGV